MATREDQDPHPRSGDPNFIPYRGSNNHGVDLRGNPYTSVGVNAVAMEDTGPAVEVYPDKPEYKPDPVPVVIIADPSPTTRKSFSVARLTVHNREVRPCVGENPSRELVELFNLGPDTVFLSADSILSDANGYPIPSGGSWSTESSSPIWVTCSDSSDAEIAICSHYVQEI